MKKLMAVAILSALLFPGAAFAGASTDAALGLGAFAVFNQIISGTGIFGGYPPAPPPVVMQPPVQQHVVVREYYPVYVQPPTYYPPVHYAPSRVVVVKERGWCPPGLARKGRCGYVAHRPSHGWGR